MLVKLSILLAKSQFVLVTSTSHGSNLYFAMHSWWSGTGQPCQEITRMHSSTLANTVAKRVRDPNKYITGMQKYVYTSGSKLQRRRPQMETISNGKELLFPDLETYASQLGNQRLPLQGIAGSQRLAGSKPEKTFADSQKLDLMVLHVVLFCLPSSWQNALFCFMDRYRIFCVWLMASNCRFPKIGTHGCQRGNHMLLLQRPAVPRGWNSCFPSWEP